jgi:hypothetical protein
MEDGGNAHRDTLFLAPLGNRCLELGKALFADVFCHKIGAFDLGCVVREDRIINEAEREMLKLEAEWEVQRVLGVSDSLEELVLADAAVDARLDGDGGISSARGNLGKADGSRSR